MTTVEIREVDARRRGPARTWWEISHAAWRRPSVRRLPAMDAEPRGAAPTGTRTGTGAPRRLRRRPRWSAPRWSSCRQLDNLATSTSRSRAARAPRRGIGPQLLADVEACAVARRTHRVVAEATRRPGETGPATASPAARGYAVANREGFKVVDWPTSRRRWPALDERVADRIGDYRIVEWRRHHARRARRRPLRGAEPLRQHGPDRRPRARGRASGLPSACVSTSSATRSIGRAESAPPRGGRRHACGLQRPRRRRRGRPHQAAVGHHDGAARAPRPLARAGREAGHAPGADGRRMPECEIVAHLQRRRRTPT